MKLPQVFVQTLQTQLPLTFSDFESTLATESPTSIRFNTFKEKKYSEISEKVKWNTNGVFLKVRPNFTLDPNFHAGAYYVQEASSMFLAEVIRQTVRQEEGLKILDLCAAPGGKSTLLLGQFSDKNLIVTNEVIRGRYKILQENLLKWGLANKASTNHDAADFSALEGFFDVLVIDAPCSGEGLFRKDKKAIQEWSPNLVNLCSARQKRILGDAEKLLKKEGLLIYSTCTYNDQENMENVAWLSQNYSYESITLKLPSDWNITQKEINGHYGYQFYPHKVMGEGFFISALRKTAGKTFANKTKKKKGQNNQFKNITSLTSKKAILLKSWVRDYDEFKFFETLKGNILALPKQHLQSYYILDQALTRKEFGTMIGSFKKNDFVPSHALALSTFINPNLPFVEVSKQGALRYLKKEKLDLNLTQKGWQLIRYEGLNLGWIKAVAGRINNYYPKEYRIRMRID